jgi:hypothetical protein
MSDLEKRIAELEAWRDEVGPYVSRMIPMGPRKPTKEENEEGGRQLKAIIEAAAVRLKKDAPPVDRTNQQLVSGAAVPEDRSHTDLKGNGQQKDYIVLTPEERAKGFVRPVRRSYIHLPCRSDTKMSQEIAETYARDPKFYNGTFCVGCGKHFPLDQFVWKDAPDEQVGS